MKTAEVSSASLVNFDFFRVDANIVQAVPHIFRRRSGLKAKFDAMTLLGLYSLAAVMPREHQELVVLNDGVKGLRFRLSSSALLDEMRFRRSRCRAGSRKDDFSATDWRKVKMALIRLATQPIKFDYTCLEKNSQSASRKSVYRKTFHDCLISLDEGDLNKTLSDFSSIDFRRPISVTLHLYNGANGRYYVLVSRRLFDLRHGLNELDTRMLFYLLRRHRGRGTPGKFHHLWELKIKFDETSGADGLNLSYGKPKRNRERVIGVVEKLARLGVLKIVSRESKYLAVQLSPDYFHNNAKK